MTNILFFLRKLKVGGVEIVTEYLANYFALQGHNIYIAYFSDCNDENLKLKFSKEVKLIPIKKSNSIFKIRKLILTEKIDLIAGLFPEEGCFEHAVDYGGIEEIEI